MTPGGKAARGGVKEADYLLAINGDPTEGLLHFDAQQMIKATGMSLQLKLSRCVCVCVCVCVSPSAQDACFSQCHMPYQLHWSDQVKWLGFQLLVINTHHHCTRNPF